MSLLAELLDDVQQLLSHVEGLHSHASSQGAVSGAQVVDVLDQVKAKGADICAKLQDNMGPPKDGTSGGGDPSDLADKGSDAGGATA